jgi:hypothetical protein
MKGEKNSHQLVMAERNFQQIHFSLSLSLPIIINLKREKGRVRGERKFASSKCAYVNTQTAEKIFFPF